MHLCSTMLSVVAWSFTSLVLTSLVFLTERSAAQTGDALQALLNQFCQRHPNNEGCHQLPPQVSVTGPDGCGVGSRRCPEQHQHCLPQEIPCDLIGSHEMCTLPVDGELSVQTLVCGDGLTGVRCERQGRVPVLTEVLMQCRGDLFANTGSRSPIAGLQVFKPVDGGSGGAGVYRCMRHGQWQPTYEGSPFLADLVQSCYYAGCGRLPSPVGDAAINQTWPFVRHLMDFSRRVLCSATLISHNAAITAAHCVTRSTSSPSPVNPEQRLISLPQQHVLQTVQATEIHVHPQYTATLLRENDLAIVKFNLQAGETFLHACISPEDIPNTRPEGVVFRYNEGGRPLWSVSPASYSARCRSIQATSCAISSASGQFCALQSNTQLAGGSSGGPYLVNVSPSLDYIWTLQGVYSREDSASATCNPNYVYIDAHKQREWIVNCALNGNCK